MLVRSARVCGTDLARCRLRAGVMRVRRPRRELIRPGFDDSPHWLRKARKKLASRRIMETCLGRPTPEKLALVVDDLSKDLEILNRYERRALRRNSAIHAFCMARWRRLCLGASQRESRGSLASVRNLCARARTS